MAGNVELITGNVESYTVGVIPYETETDYIHIATLKKGRNLIEVRLLLGNELTTKLLSLIDVYQVIPRRFRKPTYSFIFDRFDVITVSRYNYTLLCTLKEKTQNINIFAQINMYMDDIIDIRYISKLYNTTKVYLGFNSSYIVKFIDDREIRIPNFGLLYIDTENPDDVSGKYIRMIRVAVTDEQKREMLDSLPSYIRDTITYGDDAYPLIDDWNEDPVVYRLPNNIESANFDFSTGMGVLKFKDGNQQ